MAMTTMATFAVFTLSGMASGSELLIDTVGAWRPQNCSASKIVSSTVPQHAALMQWAIKHGVDAPSVTIGLFQNLHFVDKDGAISLGGMVATAAVFKGDTLLKVPENTLLTRSGALTFFRKLLDKSSAEPIIKELQGKSGASGMWAPGCNSARLLELHMMHEFGVGEASFFYPYLASLPPIEAFLPAWSEDEARPWPRPWPRLLHPCLFSLPNPCLP